jgi:hypothetical protein
LGVVKYSTSHEGKNKFEIKEHRKLSKIKSINPKCRKLHKRKLVCHICPSSFYIELKIAVCWAILLTDSTIREHRTLKRIMLGKLSFEISKTSVKHEISNYTNNCNKKGHIFVFMSKF